MSCRPGLLPSTRTYAVRRLDSVEQEVTLLKKALGQECLDRVGCKLIIDIAASAVDEVCKSLGIIEKDYFGLRYVDKNGEHLWINLRNPLFEQLHVPQGARAIMEMRVKYFVQPQKLLQPVTRLHFYKQLKKDLILGKLKTYSVAVAARFTAFIAQIDKGEYRPGMQYHQKVTSQTDNDNLDARVRREHQKLAGISVDVVIEKFLSEAASLEHYGMEMYPVVDSHHSHKLIGVGPNSIAIYSAGMELKKRYSYSAIQYTAFHAKKFTALMNSPSNSGTKEQLDFELRSRSSAQALYRTITEFHTFFRRESVSTVVKTAGFCKSLLGNFKGQNPDRFYFDVLKTHREVVDCVWAILHPNSSEGAPEHSSRNSSPASDRSSDRVFPPLPPIPGEGLQRSRSMRSSERNRVLPLPPYSQRSFSTDMVPTRSARPRGPHRSVASFDPYISPSISETGSDDDYMGGGSDSYVTMSQRSERLYIPSTGSEPSRSSARSLSRSDRSDVSSISYITSGDSECSASSFDHQRINSPPPLYSEIDPERAGPLQFTSTPTSGLMAISPIIPLEGNGAVFDFDAASVLARTRELEGELHRLRSAMTCRLCKENPIGATFCPCGHTVCCYSCAQRLSACWECDQSVQSVQRMLLTR